MVELYVSFRVAGGFNVELIDEYESVAQAAETLMDADDGLGGFEGSDDELLAQTLTFIQDGRVVATGSYVEHDGEMFFYLSQGPFAEARQWRRIHGEECYRTEEVAYCG